MADMNQKCLLSHWKRFLLAGGLSVAASSNALAQGYSQSFTIVPATGSAQSETLPYSPTNPGGNLTSANPLLGGISDPTSAVTSVVSNNGTTVATYSFPAGNRAVIVTIPSLGQQQIFSGGSRTDNLAQALSYTETRVPNLFVTLGGYNNPTSSQSVVAGNPVSLVPLMMSRSFRVDTGIGTYEPSLPAGAGTTVRTPSAVTLGGEFTAGNVSGTGFWAFTAPVDYRYFFDNPRYSITVDAPLTYLRFGNGNVGIGSLGASFRFPMAENWDLSVGLRGGAVGSEDLKVGATAYSGTLSSQYRIYFGDYKLTIGNTLGFIHTSGFRVDNAQSGPALDNVPLINGVALEGSLPFPIFDRPASYEAYVVDSYYAGRPISLRHYDELGVNFGTRGVLGQQSFNQARFGVFFSVGRSFQAGGLRFSYRF